MRSSVLLLNLLSAANASVADSTSGAEKGVVVVESKNRHHRHRSRGGSHQQQQLRGLSGNWQRVPGRATPFVAEVVEEVLEEKNEHNYDDEYDESDNGNVVLVYEEEEEGENQDEEIVAVFFKEFDHEDEIVNAMAENGHGTKAQAVTWKENNDKKKKKGEEESNKRGKRAKGGGGGARKRQGGRVKTKTKTPPPPPTMAPTVTSALSFEDAFDEYVATTTVPPPDESTASTNDDVFSWEDPSNAPQAPQTPQTTTTTILLLPACPPHYDASVTYSAGDTIEEYSRIYTCRSPPYEAYCNIVEMDDGWDRVVQDLWKDAWTEVGDCAKVVVEEDAGTDSTVGDLGDYSEGAQPSEPAVTEELPIGPTEAPLLAVAVVAEPDAETLEAAATSTVAPPAITSQPIIVPPCPSDYDATKTTYVAGDRVTVKSHVFVCNNSSGGEEEEEEEEEAYYYCNVAAWDDALLEENGNAKEMWTGAWVDEGPCEPTHEEMMEEEAEADTT